METRNRQGQARGRQGGYSIVEIGIVLVAFSLVVSSAMWSFSKSHNQERYEDTEAGMLAAHQAIVSYALRNRTITSHVIFEGTTSTDPVSNPLMLPSGRPVLPCPDVDGDGLEDRRVVTTYQATLTLTYDDDTDIPVVQFGDLPYRCMDYKGNLPWRTLGVKPYDPWGSIYTYYVDPNFTTLQFGFDQSTRASPVFKYLAVPLESGDYTYAVSYLNLGGVSTPAQSGQYTATSNNRLTQHRSGMVLGYSGTSGNLQIGPNNSDRELVGLSSRTTPANTAKPEIVAGELFLARYEHYRNRFERRPLRTGSGPEAIIYEYRGVQVTSTISESISTPVLANGVAFVVLSHGKNRIGARTYRSDLDNQTTFSVIPEAEEEEFGLEMLNFRESWPRTTKAATPTGTCTASITVTCAGTTNSPYTFMSGHRRTPDGTADAGGHRFDDIVTWMTPAKLAEEMRRRAVFPLKETPVAVLATFEPYNHETEFDQ